MSFISITFTIFLILFLNTNLDAAKSGLLLWANNVVPSLFPFLIAVELLQHTNLIYYLSKAFKKIIKPLFNVSESAIFPLIMGTLSGYPIGAKIVCDMYNNKYFSKYEAESILSFTNNSGPLFIIGTIGISFLKDSKLGIYLFITHIISSILVGIIFGFYSRLKKDNKTKSKKYEIKKIKKENISSLGNILTASILNSTKTLLLIGGFVTLFSIIISMLQQSNILLYISNFISNLFNINVDLVNGILIGFIELTNGASIISKLELYNVKLKIAFIAFILGFGGISVLLQVIGIISKYNLSCKKYILGKFLQGILSSILIFIFYQ